MKRLSLILISIIFVSGCLHAAPASNDNSTQQTEQPIQQEIEPEVEELTEEQIYWNERIDEAFKPVHCPPTPKRYLPDGYYKGPMIDAHIHMMSIPDASPGTENFKGNNLGTTHYIDQWICMMDYENTSKALVFFPVWEPITNQSIDVVKRSMEEYPGRFIPFIMPPDDDGSPSGSPTVDAQELEEMLNVQPGLFKGYGEIGLYERPNGAPDLPPNSQRLKEIYPVVRKHNLTVYFHLGEGQKEAFEETLDANPDINFIFHGDQLIQCGSCDGTLDDVAEILENHPNVYYGVDELYGDVFLLNDDHTKEEFLAHFKDYDPLLEKDLETWKDFIEDHPNQVMWDTDRGVGSVWSIDTEVALTLNNYSRAFIGKLDPSVQERFAYKNAEHLLT